MLIAGISGLVAGALSMAAGEYVSVSSQADVERSVLAQERRELKEDHQAELAELTQIYVGRGLEPALARKVAEQLMKKDALGAHARDELGITEEFTARPLQAAIASAVSFSGGAVLPLVVGITVSIAWAVPAIYGTSLLFLVLLGVVGARMGGAPVWAAALRVGFWGALAMAVTAGIGMLFHVQL
jgi:VIT1/CCC1 family predicted Fe2+/Mn2+ transporter